MFRFFATVWDPTDSQATAHAERISRRVLEFYGPSGAVIRNRGLVVHWAGVRSRASEAYLLSEQQGVVLGKVFSRNFDAASHGESITFDQWTTAALLRSKGRSLIERFWGRYVAFIQDDAAQRTWIIRDPTGTLPCFITTTHGVQIVFSSIEDCLNTGLRFSVAWDYVAMHLAAGATERLNGTGLSGIMPVHAGECVELRRDHMERQFYWDPFSIARTNIIDDPDTATCELRKAVTVSVHAWASCYDSILHRLSGGLDSSIVASCLSRAPSRPSVTCLNHYSSGGESDERDYARAVAQYTRLELIERERGTIQFNQLDSLRKYPHARYARYAVENTRLESIIAEQHGASAIFSGEWGDALFHIPIGSHPAIDYAWHKGLHPSLFSVALDTARLRGELVWKVLRDALADGIYRKPQWNPYGKLLAERRTLLAEHVVQHAQSGNPFSHPWAHFPTETPLGTCRHIFESLLLDLHPFYDPLGGDGDPDQVAPLNSQPLIEVCLRIPTYILTTGGWDRAIARRAFHEELPLAIVTRRTKGDLETWEKIMFANNRDYIRRSLLEGQLVSHGLLDRTKLERALAQDPARMTTGLPEVYWYLCMEAWLRTSCDDLAQAAA